MGTRKPTHVANGVRRCHSGGLSGAVNADAAIFDNACSLSHSGYSRCMSVCVIACHRVDTGLGNPAGAATIASPAIGYMPLSMLLTSGPPSSLMWHAACNPKVRGIRLHGVGVQKLTSHAMQSEREQVGLLLDLGCGASLFPVAESDPPAALRCSCGSPVVMWECEYFCSTTANLCSNCSRAVA